MHMTGSRRGMTAAQAWVLGLTSVSSLMVALDALVVTTALPVIRVRLHASLAELEWTVNAYVLSLAVLLMTGASSATISDDTDVSASTHACAAVMPRCDPVMRSVYLLSGELIALVVETPDRARRGRPGPFGT